MGLEEEKKRSRPIPTSSQRSKKRQKIERTALDFATDVKKIPVALDSLPWNEVEMPDMFEDAEGFFGLEEVENIEVVRDGNTLQFISAKVLEFNDKDEFEGFEDDESGIAVENVIEKPRSNKPAKVTEKDRKVLMMKFPDNSGKDTKTMRDLKSNSFAALKEDVTEEEVDLSGWRELELTSELLSAIANLKFSKPTHIQKSAIPEIIGGHDVVGKASTGSGKTLAFAIPIVEKWLSGRGQQGTREFKLPTALILSPTRELAHQLTDHIKALCSGLSIAPYVAAVTGGLSIQKQQRQLTKADIIIGTPGRLWEVISSSIELSKSIRQIDFLVVDEADRLLTEGHFKEAEEILNALDRQTDGQDDEEFVPTRQTLVFSATFHKDLQQKLAGKGKHGLMNTKESMEYLLKKLNFREERPKFIDVNPISQMAEGLREGIVECAGTEKDLYLYALLLYHPSQRALIFTNSIHSVRRLVPLLQNLSLPTLALHSQMPQKARLRSIERFSSPLSPSSILVATDVAARGLDISSVHLVIHYHLPRTADMYVHRSGRTARASASGSSILLCAPEEVVGMRRLVAKVHAQNAVSGGGNKSKYYMRSLDLDRKVVARLKPRVTLAKHIADSALAKEKKGHDDDWVRTAADELGADYDSDEFEAAGGGKKGRGAGRKKKEREARELTKGELSALKAELKALLSHRVNVGVSERYLTAGTVDIDELLRGAKGDFLGKIDGIGLNS